MINREGYVIFHFESLLILYSLFICPNEHARFLDHKWIYICIEMLTLTHILFQIPLIYIFISCVGLRFFFLLLLFHSPNCIFFPPHFFRSISSVWIELMATREMICCGTARPYTSNSTDTSVFTLMTKRISSQLPMNFDRMLIGAPIPLKFECHLIFFFFFAITKAIRSEKRVRGRLSSSISFIQEEKTM